MFEIQLLDQAAQLIHAAKAAGLKIATAESCTGGLLSGLLTQVAGSSAVFERGFVTYSNEAKTAMLGVEKHVIDDHGAVSAAVARAMAIGALAASPANIAVSITGIAGPDGGSETKPVGLVYLACASREGAAVISKQKFGDLGRDNVRQAALAEALALLLAAVGQAVARP